MTLNNKEQKALNAWLTLRQNLIENKPIDLNLIKQKDKLMQKLNANSPVFAHINLIQNNHTPS